MMIQFPQKVEREPAHAVKSNGAGSYAFSTFQNQAMPEDTQILAQNMGDGHYALYTALNLKGRGVVKDSDTSTKWAKGSKAYTVTRKAYENLKKQYIIALEM